MSETPDKAWHRLDNAAKIFPPTSSKSDTKVFRFSCELMEPVNGDILQTALDYTIEDFPSFRYILKRGMFWYYLEQSNLVPLAQIESTPPCSTFYLNQKKLLFNVTWYGNRINFEVYHVLTDGTGALQFLKALIWYYLKLVHPSELQNVTGIDYDASEFQQQTDSYSKFYDQRHSSGRFKKAFAYQLKGARESEGRLKIIEGTVSTKALLEKAHAHNATATVFITALLIYAICSDMSVRDRRKPITISVPVNLRNYFDSKSMLNFFSTVKIKYDFHKDGATLLDVIVAVKHRFSEQLNAQYLQGRLNKLFALEQHFLIRLVPLTLKNWVMNAAYALSAREITAAVSNLGRVTMPEETKGYIRLFDIFSSTRKLQICMCSFEDTMNISFTSAFINTDIQRGFFRQLTQMGVAVEIAANRLKGQ